MNDLLKKRMASTKQASELAASDEAYEKIFREPAPAAAKAIADLPLDLLDPFRTADIGFKPYPEHKLQAFAEQLQTEGLLVRIIVRPKADGRYEILAGHNRTSAAKLAGWTKIAAEIVEADDARAIVIATSTNLIQRQQLSIVERGKAYKALLDAKNRQGQWYIGADKQTSGENRQKYDEVYGSRYNYGGKNVSDYQIPELPYGTYSNTSIGVMEKVRLPGQTVSYGGLAVDFGGISGAVSGSTITVIPSVQSVPVHEKTAYTSAADMVRSDGSIGTLNIPSLGINRKVWEGETDSSMAKGVAHYSSTTGWDGNIGLCGHNRGTKYAIGSIKDLKLGDTITYTTVYGTRTYEVSYVGTIDSTDW